MHEKWIYEIDTPEKLVYAASAEIILEKRIAQRYWLDVVFSCKQHVNCIIKESDVNLKSLFLLLDKCDYQNFDVCFVSDVAQKECFYMAIDWLARVNKNSDFIKHCSNNIKMEKKIEHKISESMIAMQRMFKRPINVGQMLIDKALKKSDYRHLDCPIRSLRKYKRL